MPSQSTTSCANDTKQNTSNFMNPATEYRSFVAQCNRLNIPAVKTNKDLIASSSTQDSRASFTLSLLINVFQESGHQLISMAFASFKNWWTCCCWCWACSGTPSHRTPRRGFRVFRQEPASYDALHCLFSALHHALMIAFC